MKEALVRASELVVAMLAVNLISGSKIKSRSDDRSSARWRRRTDSKAVNVHR